jgi:folate-binding protein YgfZ
MTNDASPQSGRLLHLGALRFTGSDAVNFLQGQVSNDTRRLEQSQSMLAAYSSPQGRVLALMHLMPHSSGIVAILPRELVSQSVETLRKYVLRSKVKIEDASESVSVAGTRGMHPLERAGISPPPSNSGYIEKDGVGIAAVNRDPGRYWVIGAAQRLAERGLAGGPDQTDQFERDWRLADIRAGLPQIYLPTRETFVAQMLNLDLLDGISFSKGCYTGQEIIARTQHLGRIKRRLYRLQLPLGEWRIGQPLRLEDGRTGRLVEVVRIGDAFEALAVLTVGASARTVDGNSGDDESAADAPIAADCLPLPYEF